MTQITYEFVDPRYANPAAIIGVWVDAIRQKDAAYYAYLCQHGRNTSFGQEEEAAHMGNALRQSGLAVVFALAKQEPEDVGTLAGFLIARRVDADTVKISRLCSVNKLGDEDISQQKIGSNAFKYFVQNIETPPENLITEAHQSGQGFWEKMGMRPKAPPHFAWGTMLVDMGMDKASLIHWKEKGCAPS